jgi:hypothetical protein
MNKPTLNMDILGWLLDNLRNNDEDHEDYDYNDKMMMAMVPRSNNWEIY